MAGKKTSNVNINVSGTGSVSIGGYANIGGVHEAQQSTQRVDHEASPSAITPFDVFLSYSQTDRGIVEKIADALETMGLTVWYDRELQAGDAFIRDINRRLERARAILVVWSNASTQSEWVLNEAEIARARGTLIALRIDDSLPPAPFRLRHSVLIPTDKAGLVKTLESVKPAILALPAPEED